MLKVINLSCQKGYNQLFNKLSFTVSTGDILRITGVNGSGKTSLLKILAGLSTAETGEILLNQDKVKSQKYQQDILYLGHLSTISSELSVVENLQFLIDLNQTNSLLKPIDALDKLGLKNYANEYCSTLSAGQKRRVILSALFLSRAIVWLLDEPFTALDRDGIQIIQTQIKQHCAQGGMCILTTHQDAQLPQQKILAL